jgi:hypothetical protein
VGISCRFLLRMAQWAKTSRYVQALPPRPALAAEPPSGLIGRQGWLGVHRRIQCYRLRPAFRVRPAFSDATGILLGLLARARVAHASEDANMPSAVIRVALWALAGAVRWAPWD